MIICQFKSFALPNLRDEKRFSRSEAMPLLGERLLKHRVDTRGRSLNRQQWCGRFLPFCGFTKYNEAGETLQRFHPGHIALTFLWHISLLANGTELLIACYRSRITRVDHMSKVQL